MENIKKRLGVDANVLYFNKDSKGTIWFDQSRYGLCLFDEQTGKITYGNNADALYSLVVTSIVPSQKEDVVWLGGRNDFSSHIWKATKEKQKLCQVGIHFDTDPERTITPSDLYVSKSTTNNNLSYLLTAIIPNPDMEWLGGMSGILSIDLPKEERSVDTQK